MTRDELEAAIHHTLTSAMPAHVKLDTILALVDNYAQKVATT